MSGDLRVTQSWLDDVAAAAALSGARRVLCLDDSGDRALAHALGGAEVTALTSEAGAALIALKRAGGALAWEEHVQVLGLLPFGRRVFLYHRLRATLPEPARSFWDAREELIRTGVLQAGERERALRSFQAPLTPWVLPAGLLTRALRGEAKLEGRRWRRWSAHHLGHEVARRLEAGGGPDNPFAEWMLTGGYLRPERARVYLSREGHAALSQTKLRCVSDESALDADFDALDLGDGPWPERWARLAAPGARCLWWGEARDLPELEPPLPDRSPLAPALRLARGAGGGAR
ncbi:MAG: hypothetical protein H6740_17635 [Alphaproteobacteria bacterium]|nr:hypothetical protein [Alphaproteobacteria bacterium]